MPNIYIIPNSLHEEHFECLPTYFIEEIALIEVFIVETPKVFRRLMINLNLKHKINESLIFQWNKKNINQEWWNELNDKKFKSIGVVSDAGCPAIADPGAEIVSWGHKNNYTIKPLVGPSSITLSLMASGLNGQSYTFNGYLAIKENELIKQLTQLELNSKRYNQTQIFIETPYRNDKLFNFLIKKLSPNTRLCVAANLTSKDEYIKTQTINEWNNSNYSIGKVPCIFLILA